MKKAILLIMVMLFSVTGALALNYDTEPREPEKTYQIEVVDHATQAVIVINSIDSEKLFNETAAVYNAKDGLTFIKTVRDYDVGTSTDVYRLNNGNTIKFTIRSETIKKPRKPKERPKAVEPEPGGESNLEPDKPI